MTTTEKGNIGEISVIKEALKKGYQVSIPFSHDSRYDLIIEKENKLLKVQIKYVKCKDGVIIVPLRCSKGYQPRKYEANDFDIMMVYVESMEKIYCIDYEKIKDNKNSLTLRVDKAKSGQEKKVLWAKDFEIW